MKSASDLEEQMNNPIIFSELGYNHDLSQMQDNDEIKDEIKDERLTGLNVCIARTLYVLYQGMILAALVISTALYVFNILSLVEVSPGYIHDLCSASYMWEYMLVNVICLGIFALYWLFKDKEESYNTIVLGTVIQCGLTVWGAAEVCSVSCAKKLSDTLLYTMTVINVCIVVGMFFICVLTAMAKA